MRQRSGSISVRPRRLVARTFISACLPTIHVGSGCMGATLGSTVPVHQENVALDPGDHFA